MHLHKIWFIGLSLSAVVLAGCGSQYSTAPVSGVVRYKGEPLKAGAAVRFVPLRDGDDPGKPAFATISPGGEFTLSTYKQGDGAQLGEHRVEITQKKHISEAKYAGGKDDSRLVAAARPVPAADRVPAVYSGNSSPLRVTVTAGMSPIVLEIKPAGD